MLCQQFADRCDPVDRAVFETALLERGLHGPANRFPSVLRHPSVDAAIGDDLDILVGEQHVDQNAVVVLGVPNAELAEKLQRARPGLQAAEHLRERERRFDDKANLPLVHPLAAGDRLLDALQRLRRELATRNQMVGQEVTTEALGSGWNEAHLYQFYQFHPPDAPPPPQPPPPPLNPPPPPPQPPPPPPPPGNQRPGPPR